MNTRPLVIYHSNCADGFGAAWCFWNKYRHGADYFAGDYRKPPPDVTGREVYLVDFSYKSDVVEQMLRVAKSVTLIDHHETAINDLKSLKKQMEATNNNGMGDNFGWYCDLNMSGAMLAWKYLNGKVPPPLLLTYIQDRDLWQFKLDRSREVAASLFAHEYDFAVWDELMNMGYSGLAAMADEGAGILRKQNKDMRELIAFARRRMVIGGFDVPVVNVPYMMASEAGHILSASEWFAATYIDTEMGRAFSLRTNDPEFNVAKIAAMYGGGGHQKAAGFSVPRDHPLAQA